MLFSSNADYCINQILRKDTESCGNGKKLETNSADQILSYILILPGHSPEDKQAIAQSSLVASQLMISAYWFPNLQPHIICIYLEIQCSLLVGCFELSGLRDSIPVYIGSAPRESSKEKRQVTDETKRIKKLPAPTVRTVN